MKPCVKAAAQGRGSRKEDVLQASPDRLHLPCQTLITLIQWAYVNFADGHFNPLGSVPIAGGAGWIHTDLFTIDAKAEHPESSGTLNGPMLRTLLKQRFKLKIHSESKETPVYALTVAKSGRGFSLQNAIASFSIWKIRRFRRNRTSLFQPCVEWCG